jgi:hypothetical protein
VWFCCSTSLQQSPGHASNEVISFVKIHVRIRHTPCPQKHNSTRFYRVMKTVVILALIFAVCMCSGGDASGTVKPGGDGKYKPSSSAEGGKSVQDDERIRCDVKEKYKEHPELVWKGIMEGARESTLKEINEILEKKGRLTEDDRAKIKSFICSTFGLKEGDIDNDLVRNILQTVMLDISTPRPSLECAARNDPVQGEGVERVSKFMVNVVKEPKKDPITTSDVSADPNSSSRQSGDNQRGVNGVQKQRKGKQEKKDKGVSRHSSKEKKPSGATAEFSKSGEIAMQDENMHRENAVRDPKVVGIAQGKQRRRRQNLLGCFF